MLEVVNSMYVGKCYRGKKAGAFIIHQMWKRPVGNEFFVVQCLQTNKFKSVSKSSIFRAINDKRLMVGYDWFLCSRCKGSGKNKYGNVCPRCDGIATIWIDVGYTHHDINVRVPYAFKGESEKIPTSQLIDNPENSSEFVEQANQE